MAGTEGTIAELCSNLFLLALEIQKPGAGLPEAQVLREKVLAELDAMGSAAERLGAGKSDVDDTRYALVAMIDELLRFRSDWSGMLTWEINPLQAELFGERNAGVGFFLRLDAVRQRSRDVLEVYFLCLTLGFQGRYRVGGAAELARIVETLSLELGKERGSLSPRALRTGPPPSAPRAFPLVPVAGVVLALAVMAALSLFFLLGEAREETIAAIGVFGR